MFLVWMTNYLVKYPKQAKTLAIMRKSVNVVETVHQMSSDQRFLASVVQDEAPGVPSSLFNDNGEMRENSKAELMNEICATLSDVLTLFISLTGALGFTAFTGEKLVTLKTWIVPYKSSFN